MKNVTITVKWVFGFCYVTVIIPWSCRNHVVTIPSKIIFGHLTQFVQRRLQLWDLSDTVFVNWSFGPFGNRFSSVFDRLSNIFWTFGTVYFFTAKVHHSWPLSHRFRQFYGQERWPVSLYGYTVLGRYGRYGHGMVTVT